jgi:hypothetical protein
MVSINENRLHLENGESLELIQRKNLISPRGFFEKHREFCATVRNAATSQLAT